MEKSRRKPGRPRTASRTTPLVLEAEPNLSKIEVALPASTAAPLAEYVAWVQLCSGKSADEAMTVTVDFALREVFRRDRLWRDERRGRGARPGPEPAAATVVAPPALGPPAVLPFVTQPARPLPPAYAGNLPPK